MENPTISLKDYARRHLNKWGYDPDRFARDCAYLDPDMNVNRCRNIYDRTTEEERKLPLVEGRFFDPEELTGRIPVTFCRQPKDRREHGGGAPSMAFEGLHTDRLPILTVEFDYDQIDGDFDSAQRGHCITTVEMLLWLQEPLSTTGVKINVVENLLRLKQQTLLLILCPQSLGNPTLTQLATRLGTTKQTLSKIVCDFRARYQEIQVPFIKS